MLRLRSSRLVRVAGAAVLLATLIAVRAHAQEDAPETADRLRTTSMTICRTGPRSRSSLSALRLATAVRRDRALVKPDTSRPICRDRSRKLESSPVGLRLLRAGFPRRQNPARALRRARRRQRLPAKLRS